MYIALCLVVNIKCIVCVFKGGGSQWVANQTPMVRLLFKCLFSFCAKGGSCQCGEERFGIWDVIIELWTYKTSTLTAVLWCSSFDQFCKINFFLLLSVGLHIMM